MPRDKNEVKKMFEILKKIYYNKYLHDLHDA